jgi:tetratricopeptide (TPR) repeat protein
MASNARVPACLIMSGGEGRIEQRILWIVRAHADSLLDMVYGLVGSAVKGERTSEKTVRGCEVRIGSGAEGDPMGRDYDAIRDSSAAINLKKRELQESISYEGRADAYVKTRQWDLAIRDLNTAISLQIGGAVLLMNINQFRTIYPEYKTAANEAIERKLSQTFYPDLKYEEFSKRFLNDNGALGMSSTVIPDIYLKRSDAYLKAGNWHRASIDFRRAVSGFPDYANVVDRWREISQAANLRSYIDMRTFEYARGDAIKIWIKQAPGSSDDIGPYSLQQFELNCSARQIRTVSFADYGASGELTSSREGGRWGSVIPDTLGETLYNGACRSN